MLIKLDSRLKAAQRMLDSNDPDVHEYVSGTLAVIDGNFDFKRTDGFIQFLKMTLGYVPTAYGMQDPKWQEYLDKISTAAGKLNDDAVRFKGNTKTDFKRYCKELAQVADSNTDIQLDVPGLDIMESDNLVPFMEKHITRKNMLGFYYEGHGGPTDIMHDLMDQLSRLKLEKTSHNYDISNFLTVTGYHEHVHDALNVLIQCGVYAVNCSSTRERKARSFDLFEIDNKLQYAELIIRRAEHLV